MKFAGVESSNSGEKHEKGSLLNNSDTKAESVLLDVYSSY
jgi:hypothetical protein